jgi:hypothetical protein
MVSPNRSGAQKAARVFAIAAAVIVSLVLLAVPVFGVGQYMPRDTGQKCENTSTVGTDAPAAGSLADPIDLQLRPTQKTSLAFGRTVSKRTRTLQFDVRPEDVARLNQRDRLAVDLDPFLRSDDAQLNPDMITAYAVYRDRRVHLTLCATRAGREPLGDPGTYTGAVSIIDARVARVDVPFTITLSYPAVYVVVEIAFVTVLVAAWWVWLLSRPAPGSATPKKFRQWLWGGEGIVAYGVGLVAAATALAATYFKDDDWALDPLQAGSMIATVFGAFVAAASAPRVISGAPR